MPTPESWTTPHDDTHIASSPIFWRAYARFFAENAKEAVIAVNSHGIITVFNVTAEQDFNLKNQNVVGQPFKKVFPFISSHENYLFQAVKHRKELKEVEYSYCPYTKKDGTFVHNVALIYEDDGSIGGAIWLRKDKTSLQKFQREVNDTSVHAAISQIAAGMAHEIRNPLTTARGFLQLANQNCPDEALTCYLDSAKEEIDSINKIITDFLALVHPQPKGFQLINCNDIITDVLELVENAAAMYNITVLTKLNANIPLCFLDAKQVKHALLSILQNAIQAMPQGGLLKIKVSFDAETNEIHISVSDTGKGINEENLDHIFDPFFSTRADGSGLGLTLANRIVSYHDGHIEVYSKEKKGTTIRLCFPVNDTKKAYAYSTYA